MVVELGRSLVMIALDGGLFEWAVEALRLAVGPGMNGLSKVVFYAVLQGLQAVIQGQQRVLGEGHSAGFWLICAHCQGWGKTHGSIRRGGALTPLRYRFWVDPVASGSRCKLSGLCWIRRRTAGGVRALL